MKQYCCDRCGAPLEGTVPDYYRINKDNGKDVDVYYDDDFYIGISAIYYFGDGLKADLCKRCTIEIAKEFIRASEKTGEARGRGEVKQVGEIS